MRLNLGSCVGMMASLACWAGRLPCLRNALVFFDVARLKSVIAAALQSTLSDRSDGTFPAGA